MKQSKIGMIGCGMISEVYAKNITERFGDLQLVACADLRMEAAQARAEQFGTKAMTVDELLADPDIDIVLNLTIPDQHAAVSMAALKAGKNVYSEKSLAIHMQDAKELRKFKARTLDALPNAIQCAFQIVSPSDCSGWFHSCGYSPYF